MGAHITQKVLLRSRPDCIPGTRNLVEGLLGSVIEGTSRFQVQRTLAKLREAVTKLSLKIDLGKNETTTLGLGGRISARDTLHQPGSLQLTSIS